MSESTRTQVVIVDDHPAVRLSLRFALRTARDIEIIGEAADGEEALRVCADLHPDVVLIDLRLPRQNGVETIRALRLQAPTPRVLVLTAEYDGILIPEALAAGASGYLLKGGKIEELVAAIRGTRQSEPLGHP